MSRILSTLTASAGGAPTLGRTLGPDFMASASIPGVALLAADMICFLLVMMDRVSTHDRSFRTDGDLHELSSCVSGSTAGVFATCRADAAGDQRVMRAGFESDRSETEAACRRRLSGQ